MSLFSTRRKHYVQPRKSHIGMIVALLGTLAAYLIFFPPWETREEHQSRVTAKVMQKVAEAEKDNPRLFERSFKVYDSKLTIKVFSSKIFTFDQTLQQLKVDLNNLLNEIETGHEKGVLARLNAQAGMAPVVVSDPIYTMLRQLDDLSIKSGGLSSLTLKPCFDLYDFEPSRAKYPEPKELKTALQFARSTKIIFDDTAKSVFLPKKNSGLDLRLFRRGVALSFVKETLDKAGFTDYFVFFGSDSISHGSLNGSPWKVALPHPVNPLQQYAMVTTGDRALMTSTVYEQGFTRRKQRVHPFLDPTTCEPARPTLATAVIGPDPLIAEALSVSLFVGGPKSITELLKPYPAYEIVMIGPEDAIASSPGASEFMSIGVKDDI